MTLFIDVKSSSLPITIESVFFKIYDHLPSVGTFLKIRELKNLMKVDSTCRNALRSERLWSMLVFNEFPESYDHHLGYGLKIDCYLDFYMAVRQFRKDFKKGIKERAFYSINLEHMNHLSSKKDSVKRKKMDKRDFGYPITCIDFAKNFIVAATPTRGLVWSRRGKFLYDLEVHRLPEKQIKHLVISKENLVTADLENCIRVWRLADKILLKEFKPHENPIHSFLMSDEEGISSCIDGSIFLWSLDSEEVVQIQAPTGQPPDCMAVDAYTLAIGVNEGVIHLYNINDVLKEKITLGNSWENTRITALSISGGKLMSAVESKGFKESNGWTIDIWDLRSLTKICRLKDKEIVPFEIIKAVQSLDGLILCYSNQKRMIVFDYPNSKFPIQSYSEDEFGEVIGSKMIGNDLGTLSVLNFAPLRFKKRTDSCCYIRTAKKVACWISIVLCLGIVVSGVFISPLGEEIV